MRSFKEIIAKSKKAQAGTVAVASADNKDAIAAIDIAQRSKIAGGILVGDKNKITGLINELKLDPDSFNIMDEPDTIKACYLAISLVREKKADILMKGSPKTSVLMKCVLDKEKGIPTGKTISHILVCQLPKYDKLLMITDGGMIISPTMDDKRHIIENAVIVAGSLGIKKPKVCVLSYPEELKFYDQAQGENSWISKMDIGSAIIKSPVDLEDAINKEKADILIMPNIECGNILGKSIMYFADPVCGMIIMGAKTPIVLTSRADTEETKLNSIALALLISRNKNE